MLVVSMSELVCKYPKLIQNARSRVLLYSIEYRVPSGRIVADTESAAAASERSSDDAYPKTMITQRLFVMKNTDLLPLLLERM
jgi:hypothetical protein